MPRFVILEHDSPIGRHWDLMLETVDALNAWAIVEPPDAPGPIQARALADHRLKYLDFEGPVSGGRGTVTRWDYGEYRPKEQSDLRRVVVLAGKKLRGDATLAQSSDDIRRWQFSFTPQSD